MLFGDIINHFYRIKISENSQRLLNVHFLAAAHHRYILLCGKEQGAPRGLQAYHYELFKAHFTRIYAIVSAGDFTHARDPRGRCHKKDFWKLKPSTVAECDRDLDTSWFEYFFYTEDAFHKLGADNRYGFGKMHPMDQILINDTQEAIEDVEDYMMYGPAIAV